MIDVTYRLLNLKTNDLDRHAFKDLHNILFKHTAMTFEWLDWYFFKISSLNVFHRNTTRAYGAFDGKKLIGIWCVEPKTLIDNSGEHLPVGRCFSVGIHPEYRRQNLFVLLSDFAISSERLLGHYKYILGFPQKGKPVVEAHLKSGWEHVQEINVKSWTTSQLTQDVARSDVTQVYDFCEHDGHSVGFGSELNGSFSETSTYRNYKWLGHPNHQYICLEKHTAYIVIKPYGNTYHILDVRGQSQHVRTLLNATKTLAQRHGTFEVTTWCADNEHFREDIEACGFNPGAINALSVDMLAVRITATEPLKLKICHLGMGSEEGY